jgi:CubicO group peptidase (beta-lactamase class C family)
MRMTPISFEADSVSRRRVLSLAAGAAALAASPLRRATAQITPAASPIPLPSTLAADASPQFRAVVEALVAAMRTHQGPGAAIGLLAGDREEHATVGLASLSSMRPVTPETLFQIGSISKTYTGTLIWRLIDQGALAVDKPVRTWIPDLTLMDDEVATKLTIANLLDHSAGF